MNDVLQLIGRDNELFGDDIKTHDETLRSIVKNNSFLVIGGAGSIGQSVVKEIFSRNPKRIYVVDINENNLVELVRDIRSSLGYIDGDFKTFALDCGSVEYEALVLEQEPFDYIFNLSYGCKPHGKIGVYSSCQFTDESSTQHKSVTDHFSFCRCFF